MAGSLLPLLPLLPLLRDRTRSSFATRSCRAAHPARSSSAGARTVTGHDHLRSACIVGGEHSAGSEHPGRSPGPPSVTTATQTAGEVNVYPYGSSLRGPNSRIASPPPLPD